MLRDLVLARGARLQIDLLEAALLELPDGQIAPIAAFAVHLLKRHNAAEIMKLSPPLSSLLDAASETPTSATVDECLLPGVFARLANLARGDGQILSIAGELQAFEQDNVENPGVLLRLRQQIAALPRWQRKVIEKYVESTGEGPSTLSNAGSSLGGGSDETAVLAAEVKQLESMFAGMSSDSEPPPAHKRTLAPTPSIPLSDTTVASSNRGIVSTAAVKQSGAGDTDKLTAVRRRMAALEAVSTPSDSEPPVQPSSRLADLRRKMGQLGD